MKSCWLMEREVCTDCSEISVVWTIGGCCCNKQRAQPRVCLARWKGVRFLRMEEKRLHQNILALGFEKHPPPRSRTIHAWRTHTHTQCQVRCKRPQRLPPPRVHLTYPIPATMQCPPTRNNEVFFPLVSSLPRTWAMTWVSSLWVVRSPCYRGGQLVQLEQFRAQ